MAKTSQAAVLVGKEKIEIREFPLPEVRANDGILRVEICGVCGADNAAYKNGGGRSFFVPCILGHEIIGRIDRVGKDAAALWGVKEGDRVAIEEYRPCGLCQYCLTGDYQVCAVPRYGSTTITTCPALFGGYSDFLYLDPRSLIHRVDERTSPKVLQLFIAISNGLHWAAEAGVRPGSTVLIQGPGPMGLGAVIGARECGAEKIIVTGLKRDSARLALACTLGADLTLFAESPNLSEQVSDYTGGRMATSVINTANAPQPLTAALDLAAIKATILQAGTCEQPSEGFFGDKVVRKRLTIKGTTGRPHAAVDVALRLISSGKYDLTHLSTHIYPVEQAEQAIRTAMTGADDAVHVSVSNIPVSELAGA